MKNGSRMDVMRARRPFWLPASNYYILTTATVIAFFFLVWGILHDGGDETPWVTAGVGASILLFGAVILREIVLRRARERFLRQRRDFDRQMSSVYAQLPIDRGAEKLSLEQNEELVNDIRRKSGAARTLGKFSAVHREVFELCAKYLERNEVELRSVRIGSPRLGPLRKTREKVAEIHHYHMMQWAEIDARELTVAAKSRDNVIERVEAAQKAIEVVDSALRYYPDEHRLTESRYVLIELLTSIRVKEATDKAERAQYEGDYRAARGHYKDALFLLGRDGTENESRAAAADHINAQLEKLKSMELD